MPFLPHVCVCVRCVSVLCVYVCCVCVCVCVNDHMFVFVLFSPQVLILFL